MYFKYKRNLYSNLVSYAADLLISLQSSAISQKLNFFGLVLNTEGKTLTSALLILIGGISKKLVLEYGNFWDCFSSNQSSYQAALKKN